MIKIKCAMCDRSMEISKHLPNSNPVYDGSRLCKDCFNSMKNRLAKQKPPAGGEE